MPKIRADGPSIVRIGVDPERFKLLRQAERDAILYHLDRVLSGEASAVMEWTHFSLKVDVIPWKTYRPPAEPLCPVIKRRFD